MTTHDVHSYAKPNEAVIKHLDLNLKVDFDKKQLSGTAVLTIDNIAKGNKLYLDTRDLTIVAITLDDNTATTFELKPANAVLGQELVIAIKPETKKVSIEYTTSPSAAAVQWLNPAQTAGGKQPFLFTQSQAILARTWIPLVRLRSYFLHFAFCINPKFVFSVQIMWLQIWKERWNFMSACWA